MSGKKSSRTVGHHEGMGEDSICNDAGGIESADGNNLVLIYFTVSANVWVG